MNEFKLESLIKLLDDPDDSVFNLVLLEILKEDISIVDQLEHIWETSLDGLVQNRIELIIHKIQLNDTRKKINNWAYQETLDLFEGFFLISRHHYPELKLKPIQAQLEKIKKDVWLEYRNSLTSLEKITILNHIFFNHYKFKINQKNPDSPQSCYINNVLDLRKGNPVSIAILYTLVARSLDLPVHYIDFQKNPLLGYFDLEIARIVHGDQFPHSVLFYINPSNKGAIIGPKEVDYIQNNLEMKDQIKLTEPCPDRIVIKRLIEKLVVSYQELGVEDKASYLTEIASIL
jgi:hypothetical protein